MARIRRLLAPLAGFALAVSLTLPAQAKEDEEGIPVEVRVMDMQGNPISTAVVRHPQEEERHRVNTVTGSWVASILYMPDGSMLKFDKGMALEFEVSAPGYVTRTVPYIVRKRKNVIEVGLEEMQVEEEEEEDFPIIGFGRDKPIGGIPVDDGGGQ